MTDSALVDPSDSGFRPIQRAPVHAAGQRSTGAIRPQQWRGRALHWGSNGKHEVLPVPLLLRHHVRQRGSRGAARVPGWRLGAISSGRGVCGQLGVGDRLRAMRRRQ